MATHYIRKADPANLSGLRANFGEALSVSIANSLLLVALALVVVDARGANTPAPDKPPVTYPFTFDTLLADAKRRAAIPYSPTN